mmetsp:Transcript_70948/g.118619  ORF Transcript_70948/g.118619 Transcript_70948/m.118619 type:complete len:370 (-) Transcript_70948:1459-2568(-)
MRRRLRCRGGLTAHHPRRHWPRAGVHRYPVQLRELRRRRVPAVLRVDRRLDRGVLGDSGFHRCRVPRQQGHALDGRDLRRADLPHLHHLCHPGLDQGPHKRLQGALRVPRQFGQPHQVHPPRDLECRGPRHRQAPLHHASGTGGHDPRLHRPRRGHLHDCHGLAGHPQVHLHKVHHPQHPGRLRCGDLHLCHGAGARVHLHDGSGPAEGAVKRVADQRARGVLGGPARAAHLGHLLIHRPRDAGDGPDLAGQQHHLPTGQLARPQARQGHGVPLGHPGQRPPHRRGVPLRAPVARRRHRALVAAREVAGHVGGHWRQVPHRPRQRQPRDGVLHPRPHAGGRVHARRPAENPSACDLWAVLVHGRREYVG